MAKYYEKWAWIGSFMTLLAALTLLSNPHVKAQTGSTTAFVNVNVTPMDTEQVLENQTVIVEGDRIAEIGAAGAVAVPVGATVIEGDGAFLIPGLVDMHEHIGDNVDALTLFVANGVTTVRNLNSEPPILDLREQVAAGELLGPTILAGRHIAGVPPTFVSIFERFDRAVGPMVEMNVAGLFATLAQTPSDGRIQVSRAKEEGYDFIKTQWFLSRETFDSMVATAAEVGLPLIGHIPAEVGIEHYIRSGAHPEHDYQLLGFVAKDYARKPGANPLDFFDLSEADDKLPQLVALLLESGVAFTPTLDVYDSIDQIFTHIDDLPAAPMFQHPAYRYVPPEIMHEWTNPANEEFQIVMQVLGASSIHEIIPEPAYRNEILSFSKHLVKVLHEGGVPILVGTDASDPGVVWGFSLHRELELLVEAGLTPYEALAAATRVPSETVFGDPDGWGTVEAGKRADLVLLSANPLEDIANTRQIEGVMLRGRWLPQAELQGMLDKLATKYEAEAAGMIQLEPFTSDLFGISGVMPSGWQELEPGIYTRSNPDDDPTFLFQLSAPVADIKNRVVELLADFGVSADLPDPLEQMTSDAFAWNLYVPVAPLPLSLTLALSESEEWVYVVMLVSPQEERDALAETVLVPAVMSLAPLE